MFGTIVFGQPGDQMRTSASTETWVGQPLDSLLVLSDNSVYRWVLMGATAGVLASLYQARAPVANHGNLTTAAAAVGDKTITVTLGATAVLADEYRDGYLTVQDTFAAGAGSRYLIRTHDAVAASGTFIVPLQDKVRKALTSSAKSYLVSARGYKVIVHPAPPTAPLVGVATSDLAAASYGYLASRGVHAILDQGTTVAGNPIVPSVSADGAVAPITTTQAVTDETVGECFISGGNGKWGTHYLKLD